MGGPRKCVGLVGGRGHTGSELIRLLALHPQLELIFASSRERSGERVFAADVGASNPLRFEQIEAQDLARRDMDACVLALPNGLAEEYVAVLDRHQPGCVVVDLSADYRFHPDWHYGLPELTRESASRQRRIANPGCYATAMQLALAPVLDVLAGPPACFGVSGYSGAGSRPSPRNDPQRLTDNLMPYQPVGHVHEREVSHRLGRAVHFAPHVAQFFRGISMSIMLPLQSGIAAAEIVSRYERRYGREALVEVSPDIPEVADVVNRHHAVVGGVSVAGDGSHAVVFCTLDNLLKGAATQAMQNLNLALGFDELEGIPRD